MSEAGQPGAATPGEHGDGTGPHEDHSRSGGGWMSPAAGWPPEPAAPWRRSDPTPGWAVSSPRHGDLPAPVPAGAEPRPHANGHRVNGFPHAPAEAPAARQSPVSAPPGISGEPRRDTDGDRLVVPSPRPAPAVEQQPGPAEPESGPARHASEEPPVTRASRWAEPGLPTSAPPAVQVPPVGTAASGFEVPPGLHAPTADRSPEPPSARDEPRAWDPSYPPDPAPRDPRSFPPSTEPRAGDGAEPPTAGDRPFGQAPGSRAAADGPAGDGEPAYDADRPRTRWESGDRVSGIDRALGADDADRGPTSSRFGASASPAEPGSAPVVDRRAAPPEPDWSGPSWNRPSWGSEWAPPWARAEPEASGRRARDESEPSGRDEPGDRWEPSGRRVRDAAEASSSGPEVSGRRARPEPETRDAEPGAGRRARDERPGWAAEPQRAYEPVRADPYPAPAESGRGPDIRPVYEPPAGRAPAASPVPPADRSAWAPERPASAPPVAAAGTPDGDDATLESRRPFRLRPEAPAPADPPATGTTAAGPATSGPSAASATSGAGGRDRIPTAPAPTSAPPYAARRSAPEPAPTAGPVGDDRLPDPASAVLPQRVPAEPDVPVVPEPPAVEPPAETPELARIATHLRRDDEPAPLRDRPEGFDVDAILAAVRGVAGVRDAELRRTQAGAHSLRLDLADGADAAEVSRQVARLLQERMGLAAAPQNVPGMAAEPPPPVRRRSAEPARAEPARAEPARAEPRPTESRVPRPPAGRDALPSRSERWEAALPETPRRRRQSAGPHRGRATVDEPGSIAAPAGPTGSPVTVGTSYTGGQVTTTEAAPSRPLDTGGRPGPRVVIDHVQVSTFGLDATVEVRLMTAGSPAAGYATGPAVDGYVLRLCAVAAAAAVDELLRASGPESDRGRCFVEHAAVVPFGNCEVATVVVLLVCDGWVEQLAGSALVAGDPRQAVVRATLAAVNRRLEALLA
ncbi:hypothetical protein ACTMS0_10490 [Micromonospora sp. H33]|uniref:hypothetical protein n=1 Tax=Micromonospora sp. H33 TaxID=3452215 RepID=UPI003F8864C7